MKYSSLTGWVHHPPILSYLVKKPMPLSGTRVRAHQPLVSLKAAWWKLPPNASFWSTRVQSVQAHEKIVKDVVKYSYLSSRDTHSLTVVWGLGACFSPSWVGETPSVFFFVWNHQEIVSGLSPLLALLISTGDACGNFLLFLLFLSPWVSALLWSTDEVNSRGAFWRSIHPSQ